VDRAAGDTGARLASDSGGKGGEVVIPATFDYEVAGSVDHAIELLGSKEDPKLIDGSHTLLPLMKVRLARPATLIDIGRIDGLAGVREDGNQIAVGAITRHHDLELSPVARPHCPLLA